MGAGQRERWRPSGRLVLVAASLVILAAAIAVAAVATADAELEARGQTIHPARPRVRITAPAGDVVIRVVPGETVRVARVERWSAVRPTVRVRDLDGALDIDAACPTTFSLDFGTGCSVDLDVAVPAGTAVEVEAGRGHVRATGDLDRLSVTGAVAGVDVDGCVRDLGVRVAAGGVEGTLACPPDRARLEVVAGPVRLHVPAGRYRLLAESAAGAVDVWPGVVDDGAAPRSLEISAVTGDVELLP